MSAPLYSWYIGEEMVHKELPFAKDVKDGTKILNHATFADGLDKSPEKPLGSKTNEVNHLVGNPSAPNTPETTKKDSSESASTPAGKFFDKTGTILKDYWWVACLLVVGIGASGLVLARNIRKEGKSATGDTK